MSSEFSRFVRQLEKIEMETKVKKIKINPKENAKWWYNLSLEDKQKAFYAVISRMHKAECSLNDLIHIIMPSMPGLNITVVYARARYVA